MGEGGFEPPKLLAADLQSVPFGHSGIRPNIALTSSDYNTTDRGKNQEVCTIFVRIRVHFRCWNRARFRLDGAVGKRPELLL